MHSYTSTVLSSFVWSYLRLKYFHKKDNMAKIFRYAILRQNIDEFQQICNLSNSNGQNSTKNRIHIVFDAKIMHVKQFLKICKIEPFGEGGISPHFHSFSQKMHHTKNNKNRFFFALDYVYKLIILPICHILCFIKMFLLVRLHYL